MLNFFPKPKVTLPQIFVANTVLDDMASQALAHQGETGGLVWGMIVGGATIEFVIILGVLKPNHADIDRSYAHTAIGGEGLVEQLRWLIANHQSIQHAAGHQPHPEVKLTWLFKWHSHHTLTDSYSSTDRDSIRESVVIDGLPIAIGPLVNYRRTGPIYSFDQGQQCFHLVSGVEVQIRFYVYTQAMAAAGIRTPVLVEPQRIELAHDRLIPPSGWHFANEDRFDQELRLLRQHGCQVSTSIRNTDADAPLEIVFIVRKPSSWKCMVQISTDYDYPASSPVWKLIPESLVDPTEPSVVAPFYVDTPELLEGNLWQDGDNLVSLINRLEARGEL